MKTDKTPPKKKKTSASKRTKKSSPEESKPKLIIRNATLKDASAIQKLSCKVYIDVPPYSTAVIKGQINNYPEGQFVAEYQGKIVGYCSTIRIPGEKALAPHTWREITAGGYGTTHDPNGDFLYGMEVFVDENYRGLRIGERLYNARKNLCVHFRMKGIAFGGRLPLLHKRIKKVGSAQKYIEAVEKKEIRDPVLNFQLRREFEIIGVLDNYLPSDKESLGYASHMVWRNPEMSQRTEVSTTKSVRGTTT